VLLEYDPIATSGDGNCLYRTISLAITGNQTHHVQLRVLCAIEMILNRHFYDISQRKYVDQIQDIRVVCSDYQNLLKSTVNINKFSEILNMYALSAVMGKPITSYYPPMVSSTFHTEPFTRKIIGRNVKESSTSAATVMWPQMTIPNAMNGFVPCHFVLLHNKKPTNESYITIDATPIHSDCLAETVRDDTLDDEAKIPSGISVLPSLDIDEPSGEIVTDFVESDSAETDIIHEESENQLGRPLPDDKFLDTDTVYSLLMQSSDVCDKIPRGPKENKYFVIENAENV